MAVNAKPSLSTITSPAEAVPEYPPAKVEEQANGMVLVKWGDGGVKQTSASAGTEYPSVFSVVDSDGLEPLVKTYGTLLGCDGGTLTIQGTTYRIERIPKRRQANGKKSLEDEARWTDVTAAQQQAHRRRLSRCTTP
ncbi:hypothetical protein SEMRO_208_G087040.1 [Seminavis robusta]|uniref:Uncharacterized protein n=1 Tax=Seminavis robusta TaxID=568900 RepID=A0A9N8DM39_9STRA|nr:hypothetical protein SEMRO_208_G087040.1 [Seminavis robusta]|eukprot:Sro208_g087040.1 n/a (137) ;mRNA; f:39984-40394